MPKYLAYANHGYFRQQSAAMPYVARSNLRLSQRHLSFLLFLVPFFVNYTFSPVDLLTLVCTDAVSHIGSQHVLSI